MNFQEALKIANNKHDVIGLQVYDNRETELPPVGMIKMRDAESDEMIWINSSSKKVRKAHYNWWKETNQLIKEAFSQAGVDYTTLKTGEDYVRPLVNLFKRR